MRKIIIGLLGSAGLLATPAIAADSSTATATMQVKATVEAVCSADAGATLDFGTISTTKADFIPSTPGKLMVTCSKGTSFTVTANNGANAAGTQRVMKGATNGDPLNYSIVTSVGGGTPFPTTGDDTETPTPVVGIGTAQEVDIFGKIAAGTSIPSPDSYSDQLTLTITY